MQLNDRKWQEFKITTILANSINAKAYRSDELISLDKDERGIPYITRTNLNNGLFAIVKIYDHFIVNPPDSICFGAENAMYFYQPYRYLTGNKMYYYRNNGHSKYSLLFIVNCLNKAILNCGFGYGMGLTGSRSDVRKIMLPITTTGEPDYVFMENYIKELLQRKRQEYLDYVSNKLRILDKTGGGGAI